jgi:hypothetical protein
MHEAFAHPQVQMISPELPMKKRETKLNASKALTNAKPNRKETRK